MGDKDCQGSASVLIPAHDHFIQGLVRKEKVSSPNAAVLHDPTLEKLQPHKETSERNKKAEKNKQKTLQLLLQVHCAHARARSAVAAQARSQGTAELPELANPALRSPQAGARLHQIIKIIAGGSRKQQPA